MSSAAKIAGSEQISVSAAKINGLFNGGTVGGDAKFHSNDGGLLPPATLPDD